MRHGPLSYHSLGRVHPREWLREPFGRPKRRLVMRWKRALPLHVETPSPTTLFGRVMLGGGFQLGGLR